MGKSSGKSTQKRVAKKPMNKNVRNDAKSKNLEFLLDPVQPSILLRNIKARPVQEREPEKVLSAAPVQATTQKASKAKSLQANRFAVKVPLIDLDDDHNKHLLDIRSNLLRDWNSETESDGDENSVNIKPPNSLEVVETAGGESLVPVVKKAPISNNHAPRPISTGEQERIAATDQKSFPQNRKTYSSNRAVSSKIVRSGIDMVDTDHNLISECSFDKRETSEPLTTELSVGVCVCGQQPKIDHLIQQNNILLSQNKKLKRSNEECNIRCMSLTDSLNAKVLGSPRDDVFTEEIGFPDKAKLKRFSETAAGRDYIFIKLLLLEICPEGLQNMSVTGRVSNNPNGRKGREQSCRETGATEKIRLDPEKVEYVEMRFAEHRRYQGDSTGVAGIKMKDCRSLMARVISYYGKK